MIAFKLSSVIMASLHVFLLLLISFAYSKVYDRCELARELKHIHELPEHQIATWVCIAKHESAFNTSAVNLGSGDHGLFQISDMYWCSPPGKGFACDISCSALEDDDITDDVTCIRRIFNEHKAISGNGFNAWVVYPRYCKGDVSHYISGCFDNINNFIEPENATEDSVYEFPPLPTFTTSKTIKHVPESFPTKSTQNYHSLSLLSTTTTLPATSVSDVEDVYNFPPLPTTSVKPYTFISDITNNFSNLQTTKSFGIVHKSEIPHQTISNKFVSSRQYYTTTTNKPVNNLYISSTKKPVYTSFKTPTKFVYNRHSTDTTSSNYSPREPFGNTNNPTTKTPFATFKPVNSSPSTVKYLRPYKIIKKSPVSSFVSFVTTNKPFVLRNKDQPNNFSVKNKSDQKEQQKFIGANSEYLFSRTRTGFKLVKN